ncbi:hypothetical protein EJB05_20937 [Eragrostis curvula]|uniref:Uncharacterized protein n=1 Tax=Eragrostis curvula TaxID=38414 RepID=A0A5J9V041_9POAL|nr:hypothetical protein EJB05_20927 [Eragrostis curvula]TVU29373.1 hypothetical protein EJB05_20937 [Eragrostis curvula]
MHHPSRMPYGAEFARKYRVAILARFSSHASQSALEKVGLELPRVRLHESPSGRGRVKGRGRRVCLASSLSHPRGGASARPIRPAAMAKFNVVQKNRREWKQDRKRQAHGEPGTGKLKQRTAPVSVSGKRKRKLQRRQNREQKEATMIKALENNMGDVDMVSAEESSEAAKGKPQVKFNVKKNSRIQIKRLKGKGRKKAKNVKPPTKEKVEAMVE